MKTALLAFTLSTLTLIAIAEEPSVTSPDKRYRVTLRAPKSDALFPVIILRDTRTGREAKIFDCDSVGQSTSILRTIWSPDSRYVALTLKMGPATHEFAVYRIMDGAVREVTILPIPKALDAERIGHRGGPSVERWENNRTLWVSDGQMNRSFRYRFTKQGKLLADGFKKHPTE